tara:strand:- start:2788 stop:3039 length:252 start_codon:yes stop_codon:yes gene_type:complete
VNKLYLVELADQVLTDVDDEFKNKAREHFEKELCSRMWDIFWLAMEFFNSDKDDIYYEKKKKAYESVKPVLDDCLNKILGEPE